MAEFSKLVITEKGQTLLAKMMAGEGNIAFTKVCASDETYTLEEFSELEDLSGVKQTSIVSGINRTNNVAVEIETVFSNTELTAGYYIRALGLYAVDPDAGEILYAATVETSGNCYLPPYNGVTVSGVHVRLITTVGNAENVLLEVNPAGLATVGNIRELEEKIDAKQSAEEGKGLSTEDYTTTEKAKLSGIEEGANKTVVDAELSADSENPLQNKAIKAALDAKGPNFHVGMSTPFNLSDVWIKTDFAVQGWDY